MPAPYGGYLHAWCWRCKQYLSWAAYGRRKVTALVCPDCGSDYRIGGVTPHKIGGGKPALSAVEGK